MGLRDRRDAVKPVEYNVQGFIDAITHSFRTKDEYSYVGDIQDYKVNMTYQEKEAVRKCMLAICTIEVKVKDFWASIGKHIPKPEIASVGYTFGFNEVIHEQFYSHLLEILGLNDEFTNVLSVPEIKSRLEYISKCMEGDDFVKRLTYFSLFIENVSLFSQFAILMSINKHKMYLKGLSNGVMASTLEEQNHADFGSYLINTIKKEYNTGVDAESVIDMCNKAREAEHNIIDWIFSEGEIDCISKETLKQYVDYRIYKGLASIGVEIEKVECPSALDWFDVQLKSTTHVDFFSRKSPNYSAHRASITEDDLF